MLAAPKVRAMASAAANAGLFDHGLIERLPEVKARQVADALMPELHDSEKVKAAAFLKKAKEASENQWKRIITGMGQGGAAPEIDTTYTGEDESDEGGPTQGDQVEDW